MSGLDDEQFVYLTSVLEKASAEGGSNLFRSEFHKAWQEIPAD